MKNPLKTVKKFCTVSGLTNMRGNGQTGGRTINESTVKKSYM